MAPCGGLAWGGTVKVLRKSSRAAKHFSRLSADSVDGDGISRLQHDTSDHGIQISPSHQQAMVRTRESPRARLA